MTKWEARNHKKWVKLDYASNIFLAAMTHRDTKVFRLSAEVTEVVDPELLQAALEKVYDQYRLYHSVLRRGFFWYYLEEGDLRPQVIADTSSSCRTIYHFDRKELLFRVLYLNKRISLEVFHVLSDGTGAMWFFQDLMREYLLLKHPEIQSDQLESSTYIHETSSEDSFARHFRRSEQRSFSNAAQSALRGFGEVGTRVKNVLFPIAKRGKEKVYRYKGTYTPDNRPRVVELEIPVKAIISQAKQLNVSVTVYLTALFIKSLRESVTDFEGDERIAVSVPINLRQFFPSTSARNFFSVTNVGYTYKKDRENSLQEICQELKAEIDPQLEKEHLEGWLKQLVYFEYMPISRIILRPIKDFGLKIINYFSNRKITIAISNLGRVSFSQQIDQLVKEVFFHTIAVRPQFCTISHNDVMTITFTSPFIETDIFQIFARHLTNLDIPVITTVNKVTDAELGVVANASV